MWLFIIKKELQVNFSFTLKMMKKYARSGILSTGIPVEATWAMAWWSVRMTGVFASPVEEEEKQDEVDITGHIGWGMDGVIGQPCIVFLWCGSKRVALLSLTLPDGYLEGDCYRMSKRE